MIYGARLVSVAVLLSATLLANAALKPAPAHRLRVTASIDSIEIDRATPGGTVLLIGYERTIRDFAPVYRRVQRERIADANGSVTIPIGRPIAPTSFWVAFDLESGGHGASGALKHVLREGELPEDSFRKDTNGKTTKFVTSADYMYVVAIRPTAGVWETTVGDGGESDEDGSLDGKIETGSTRFAKTRHAREDLNSFEEGDVVALFIPHQMGYLVRQVKK